MEEDEVLEALKEMVGQHCTVDDYLDSMCSSSNAAAMRVLADRGIIVVESEYGRRIIAHWKSESKESNPAQRGGG